MKIEIQRLIFLALVAALSACNKTDFADTSSVVSSKSEIPTDPINPIVSVDPVTGFKLSNGACNPDSSTNVLSCLKCEVPLIQQAPQLSVKAQALVDVMFLACQMPNKSDLTDYRPTKAELVNKLNRGSEELYPETPRTSQMAMVLEGLANESDVSLHKKMFNNL
jgi:hypothetical protein